VITYEEYYPYGSTSYQAVRSRTETPKRYRYTGKERDPETGLYYHGARYYAPWLGRWTACDPEPMASHTNLYQYVRSNPVRLSDQNGKWETDMHFGAVYWTGRLAGATHYQALYAAIASQSLDDFGETRAPDQKLLSLERQYLQGSPFGPSTVNVGGALNQEMSPMRFGNVAHSLGAPSRDTAEVVARRGIETKNIITFGLGLHTAGDFLPHANQSGDPTFGHQEGRNEDLSASHWYAHDADYTFKNPQKAVATFVRFTELWSEYRGKEKPNLSAATLERLGEFIYSGDKAMALRKGLEEFATDPEKIEEINNVISLMKDPERRKQIYLQLRSSEVGQQGAGDAFRIWLNTPYGQSQSSTKVDIAPYLARNPSISQPHQTIPPQHGSPRLHRHRHPGRLPHAATLTHLR